MKKTIVRWTLALVACVAVALPAVAIPQCLYVCAPTSCCSQRCWDGGWITCGNWTNDCNGACRAEPSSDAKDETVAARDTDPLRALVPDVCSAKPADDATPLVPIS